MHLPENLIGALRSERDIAYLLDRDGRILYVNDAWDRFARANEAPASVHSESVLGTSWIDSIHGRVRRFYAALIARAMSAPRPGRPRAWVHLSECNTPTLARTLATRFAPIYPADEDRAQWLLVIHSVVSESAIETRYPITTGASLERYLDDRGVVAQCGCCRRLRVASGPEARRWEYVPAFVHAPPPNTSHGLCGTCFESWYGMPQLDELGPNRRLPSGLSLGL